MERVQPGRIIGIDLGFHSRSVGRRGEGEKLERMRQIELRNLRTKRERGKCE